MFTKEQIEKIRLLTWEQIEENRKDGKSDMCEESDPLFKIHQECDRIISEHHKSKELLCNTCQETLADCTIVDGGIMCLNMACPRYGLLTGVYKHR